MTVISTLIEHWDGTSWSVISSPDPGKFNVLIGATALSDGTVAAVGYQTDFAGHTFGLILQNAASAPKTPTTASTTTIAATLDADALSRLFAAAIAANQQLSFGGHTSRAHKLANGDSGTRPGDVGLWTVNGHSVRP
jgi:hypothetical protein